MNKKGFTLVELLTVIALLAIFALVTIPAVDNILKKQKTKIYQQNIETIKDALKLLNNEIEIDDGDEYQLTLGDLKDEGLIDPNFKNPLTKKLYSNNSRLSITRIGEQYKYNIVSLFDAGESENSNPVEPEPQINYAFRQIGACTFNGTNNDNTNPTSPNITGEECTRFADSNFINTGVMLFSEENWEKDFDLTVNIDRYNASSITQAVIIGEMNEVNNIGQTGFVVRTTTNTSGKKILNIVLRKNAKTANTYGEVKTEQLLSQIYKIRLVRRNQKLCYSINDDDFIYIFNYSGFKNKSFNIPVYFGADTQSDSTTAPRRIYNGDLSNMSITFDVDQSITCTDS